MKPINRAGLSVIEFLVVAALVGLFIPVLMTVFRYTFRSYNWQIAQSSIQLSSRASLERITEHSQQARAVVASQGTYTTGSTTLILQLPAIDASQTIIPLTYDYIIYRPDPTNPDTLQEIIQADASSARQSIIRSLQHNLGSISFNYYDSAGTVLSSNNYPSTKRVLIDMVAQEIRYRQTIEKEYREYATLRNK